MKNAPEGLAPGAFFIESLAEPVCDQAITVSGT